MELEEKTCIPCQADIPPLKQEEIASYMEKLEGWQVEDNHHLHRSFSFEDYEKTLEFVNQVGEIAEEENHHPDICFTWGKADIKIYTHKIDGLHENDFILAAKINNL